MGEEVEYWKIIIDYPGYEVSSLGNVRSKRFPSRFMSLNNTHDRYYRICLSIDGVNKRFSVHRLVAIAFIPNPQNKPTVNHINGIRTDNRVINLEWNTISENTLHSFAMGLQKPQKTASVKVLTPNGVVYDSMKDAWIANKEQLGISLPCFQNYINLGKIPFKRV